MAAFRCRCCGAGIEVNSAQTFCECSYCGVMQTVPILDFDEKAILWERADNLRRGGEYDRAMTVYGQLAELCPDDPDVYWSKTLCRYGVEYVEEHGSHKRIPTLNRIQYEPVTDDADYRKAASIADDGRRRVYIMWARQLEELRKTTLAVTLTEQPYDIFICYKETDANGRRTEDSVLAAQLYRSLTADGWRVFFSRVTLEDKAGTAYEPYIFAALNSAKIMLTVGTKPEHFNAVWTRNEWSRFLALTDGDTEKTLAVLYKGMLPAQLPEEFSHLRRFDMADPDFYEDLMRGVRKTLKTAVRPEESKAETEERSESADASSLIRRARLLLEDEKFTRADELCEQALNFEPENAEGYLVKLLAECRLSSEEQLGSYHGDFTRSGNYAKAMRFGSKELQDRLRGYSESSRYETYTIEMSNAVYEEQLLAIAERFDALGNYSDSVEKAKYARETAEKIRSKRSRAECEHKYRDAIALYNAHNAHDELRAQNLSIALESFLALGDYEDSAQLAESCRADLNEINERLNSERERERADRAAQRQRKEKLKKLLIKAAAVGVPACMAVIVAVNVISSAALRSKYNAAAELFSGGRYDEAAAAYAEIRNYSDSAERMNEARYRQALSLLDSGSYDEAKRLFNRIMAYSDSKEQMLRADYLKAVSLAENGGLTEAASLFKSLGNYLDSSERASAVLYEHAVSLENDHPEKAAELYSSLGSYMDSAEKYLLCSYSYAEKLFDDGDFGSAEGFFESLGSYSDSAERVLKCQYSAAVKEMENGDLETAAEQFAALGGYDDAPQKLLETQYKLAEKCYDSGEYIKAADQFDALGSYSDSAERRDRSKYAYADRLAQDGDIKEAMRMFELLGEYGDSADRALEIGYNYAQQLADEGNYRKAISQLEKLDGYKDAAEKIPQMKYKLAEQLRDNKFYADAIKLFEELGDYSDAHEQAASTEKMHLVNIKIGEYMTMGNWQQGSYGAVKPLEWLVIGRDGTRVLVISKYLVDFMPFGAMTWADSDVRKWLNDTFYTSAFTGNERIKICDTTLSNPDSKEAFGGGDTVDKVFVLSEDEVKKYIPDSEKRKATYSEWGEIKLMDAVLPTLPEGHIYASSANDSWWLRSVGERFCINVVYSSGYCGNSTRYDEPLIGVRPAMWIEMGE
ncbi:MAG: TIR domain-containing protein [Ruminococcaceae bacterium]|nr:TIR domain-containing protein [Oscillospiraceae bacterium]